MKVKIVKCSDKDYWYKGRIGEAFEIIKELEFNFTVADMGIFRNILKSDTIPLNEIRYELKSTVIYDTCVTSCEHKKNTMVGSVGCSECEYNCGDDKVNQTVLCSWQKMKRLDIMKDYMDNKISTSRYVSIANSKEYTRVQIGEDLHFRLNGDVTLDQVNAILKVMGLDYELYEMDWGKVEEGAEVVFWLTCGNLKGQVRGKFNSYIPNLKKVIVIVGDKVKVVDEDEVELC